MRSDRGPRDPEDTVFVRIVTVLALVSVGFLMGLWVTHALERQTVAELERAAGPVKQRVRW